MNVLSIDSSRYLGGVAILSDEKLKFSIIFSVKATYSQKLLYMIDYALKNSKMNLEDIDLISVAKGPGSFTGLRIGMAIAKSFGFSKNIPVVSINTLKSVSYSYLNTDELFLPIFDARRNQIYAAAYKKNNNNIRTVISTGSYYLSKFIQKVKKYKDKKVFMGEALTKFKKSIEENFENFRYIEGIKSTTAPISLALLGRKKFYDKGADKLLEMEPSYYRKSDAEINYEKNKNSE